MSNIWKILKRDIHRLLHNKLALLVIFGVCFLPSLYAWFNIAANMDPYSNTQEIKIAIVNQDQPSQYSGKTMNLGEKIVEKLKENDRLGWVFTDKKKALDGLRSGEYYAVILIPKDFTYSFTSIVETDKTMTQPKLDYYVNEKKNSIAPKITDTGIETLQDQINKEFTATASEVISANLKNSSESLFQQMEEGNISTKLSQTRERVLSLKSTLKEMKVLLKKVDPSLANVKSDIKLLNQTVESGQITLRDAQEVLEKSRMETEKVLDSYDLLLHDLNNFSSSIDLKTNDELNEIGDKIHLINNHVGISIGNVKSIVSLNSLILEDLQNIGPQIEPSLGQSLLDRLTKSNQRDLEVLGILQSENTNLESSLQTLGSTHLEIQSLLEQARKNSQENRIYFQKNLQIEANKNLDSLSQVNGSLSSSLNSIQLLTQEFEKLLDQVSLIDNQASSSLDSLESSLTQVDKALDRTQSELKQIQDSPLYEKAQTLTSMESKKVSSFLKEPIDLEIIPVYKVDNYGSAMTPFFTNLALWVGGMILLSIIKMEVDKDASVENFALHEAYLARWLLYVLLGFIQSIIVALGDLFLIGAQCQHPLLFLFTSMACSLSYVSLIYSLGVTFKHIGKALCVLLVILQIPGSSGTYPIEMVPSFFQFLYPILPFNYGVNAFREAMFGVYFPSYLFDLFALLLFLLLSFIIGLFLRKMLFNINRFFDKKLYQSEIMLAEEDKEALEVNHSLLLHLLKDDQEKIQSQRKKHQVFFTKYKKRVRFGFLLVFTIPLLLLMVLFSIDSKILALFIWILSVITITSYLIYIEYTFEKYKREINYMDLSQEDLLNKIQEDKVKK